MAGKKQVLVVDDSFEDLQTMETVLKKEGYSVSSATNGARAIELMAQEPFDLVLIDIRMPALSGYDLLRMMRKRAKKRIKIFYVSILPQNEVMMENCDGFIQKPFSPTTLTKTVKRAFEEE